jgi:hypothetical protein
MRIQAVFQESNLIILIAELTSNKVIKIVFRSSALPIELTFRRKYGTRTHDILSYLVAELSLMGDKVILFL